MAEVAGKEGKKATKTGAAVPHARTAAHCACLRPTNAILAATLTTSITALVEKNSHFHTTFLHENTWHKPLGRRQEPLFYLPVSSLTTLRVSPHSPSVKHCLQQLWPLPHACLPAHCLLLPMPSHLYYSFCSPFTCLLTLVVMGRQACYHDGSIVYRGMASTLGGMVALCWRDEAAA